MTLLKRLSQGLWSYVSPEKPDAADIDIQVATPQSALQQFKKPAIPHPRSELERVIRRTRSMSPTARVDSWQIEDEEESEGTGESGREVEGGRKRKGLFTPSSGGGRGKRMRVEGDGDGNDVVDQEMMDAKMDDTEDLEDGSDEGTTENGSDDELVKDGSVDGLVEDGQDSDNALVDEYDDSDEALTDAEHDQTADLASGIRAVHMRSASPTSSASSDSGDDIDQDTTLVVSEEEYTRDTTPLTRRRKPIHVPAEHSSRGVSSADLRAAGWGAAHIALVQKIAMRGFEPLLPRYYMMDYRYLPDALFAVDNVAFLSSLRGAHYKAIVALNKLLEIGGRVRDCVLVDGNLTPEQQVRRSLRLFIKWALADAELDPATTIPVLALSIAPADTPAAELQESARRKMARLHARYEAAFRVAESIEPTTHPLPTSTPETATTTTLIAHPIPQLYALIASHTFVALMAYRPDLADEGQVKLVSHFDLGARGYDVWNALALAIVVCQARNVLVGVAEETGVGARVAAAGGGVDDGGEDVDL
ncbi:hypothetical protein LTR08_005371 [Meristemomyces frigidus]|nr:hypothetical protein LTR08_005371 [Meristemomyces frigidus]